MIKWARMLNVQCTCTSSTVYMLYDAWWLMSAAPHSWWTHTTDISGFFQRTFCTSIFSFTRFHFLRGRPVFHTERSIKIIHTSYTCTSKKIADERCQMSAANSLIIPRSRAIIILSFTFVSATEVTSLFPQELCRLCLKLANGIGFPMRRYIQSQLLTNLKTWIYLTHILLVHAELHGSRQASELQWWQC